MTTYKNHFEAESLISALPQAVFDYVDDHSRFYSHVVRLARLFGGINLHMDDLRGQAVGSQIRLSGKFLRKSLTLEEVVTKREPPHVKSWETVGTPNFLIIGSYRLDVHVEPKGSGSMLRVSMGYDAPANGSRLRRLFSGFYARLCAREMVKVTQNHFKK